MKSEPRHVARLFSLETSVNELVLKGKRNPHHVAEVLQLINDDPAFMERFFGDPDPHHLQDEPFKVYQEIDLEVDYTLTPDEIFDRRENKSDWWTAHEYTGKTPEPGVRRVKLCIGRLKIKAVIASLEGFAAPGAWVALAYLKARPKWKKGDVDSLEFPADEASQWAVTTRPTLETNYREPGHKQAGLAKVGNFEKGPWVNRFFIDENPVNNFHLGTCALIRKP